MKIEHDVFTAQPEETRLLMCIARAVQIIARKIGEDDLWFQIDAVTTALEETLQRRSEAEE